MAFATIFVVVSCPAITKSMQKPRSSSSVSDRPSTPRVRRSSIMPFLGFCDVW